MRASGRTQPDGNAQETKTGVDGNEWGEREERVTVLVTMEVMAEYFDNEATARM